MKVALTSDTHGRLPVLQDGIDAVLHAGDIGVDVDPIGWFQHTLYPWAEKVRVPIYATFGNHDRIGERHAVPDGAPPNLHLIVDEERDVLGVPVWFSPWSPLFNNWAFMVDEKALAKKYAKIPDHIQVIVSHTPPFGCGDRTLEGERHGSTALLNRIERLPNLRLVVCGHIHEGFGSGWCFGVPVYNVSFMDGGYRPKNKPVIIDWPPAIVER